MVNLKRKVEKHANDDEKRRKSLKEKEKARLNQSEIIRQALTNNSTSKKIKFDNDDVENGSILDTKGKLVLFDNSDGESEDLEIREKAQFSGKNGLKLLNLQSRYGNDERFQIDERFLEDEKVEFQGEDHKVTNDEEGKTDTEKAKQLRILETVLETPVLKLENEKKATKRTYEMVRYDVTNKDHKIFEISSQSETSKPSKKKRDGKRTPKADMEDLPKPQVSKEKFYEVSKEIKNRFKEKKEESSHFSVLQTYGANLPEEQEEVEEETDDEKEQNFNDHSNNKNIENKSESKARDRTEETDLKSPNKEEKEVTAKGIWKEPFFFVQDDFRFKEGLEFINKKNSSEANKVAENYHKTRKQMREILRLHLKKQLHQKDPFKNKVGGMNKKQLANSKLKNSKGLFNKRAPPKKIPGRRT